MKCTMFVVMMALAIASRVQSIPTTFYRASTLGGTHETELLGYSDPVVIDNTQSAASFQASEANAYPKTFYRAITPGAVHETELFGYSEPVIIDNSGAAPGFSADAPVQSAASWEASASAQPAAAFKAGASYSAAESAPIGLQKTFYRAITPGAVHETELFGYSEPVIIDNSGAAPGFSADASAQPASTYEALPSAQPAASFKAGASYSAAESAPIGLQKTFYRAITPGAVHETELFGYSEPVIIDNSGAAPGFSADASTQPASTYEALPSAQPAASFKAGASYSAAESAPIGLQKTFYRAITPGAVHETELFGYSEPVIIDNSGAAPGFSADAPVQSAASWEASASAQPAAAFKAGASYSAAESAPIGLQKTFYRAITPGAVHETELFGYSEPVIIDNSGAAPGFSADASAQPASTYEALPSAQPAAAFKAGASYSAAESAPIGLQKTFYRAITPGAVHETELFGYSEPVIIDNSGAAPGFSADAPVQSAASWEASASAQPAAAFKAGASYSAAESAPIGLQKTFYRAITPGAVHETELFGYSEPVIIDNSGAAPGFSADASTQPASTYEALPSAQPAASFKAGASYSAAESAPIGLQKTFYRAITPGAVHETELFGYSEPVIIDNSGAAPGFSADAPVQSAASWEASASAQPAAAFKAGASYSAAESAPIGLQKTFYRAITPGAVHETELFGYSEPVIIDNSGAAPGFSADASTQPASTYEALPSAQPAAAFKAGASYSAAESAPIGLQKTFYRAITPGAVHETELFGYSEPVIIDNSGAAPGFSADASAQPASTYEALPSAQPAASFKAGASYSAAESAPIGLQKTFYRAITPGAVHETELFGYSEPVIIDNSGAAPGFSADASAQPASTYEALPSAQPAASFKAGASYSAAQSAPIGLQKTFYRAITPGAVHETELFGYSEPVIIDNSGAAPGFSADASAQPASTYEALPSAQPAASFKAGASYSAAESAPIGLQKTFYRAITPGAVHETELFGYSEPVIIDNSGAAPGFSADAPVQSAASWEASASAQPAAAFKAGASYSAAESAPIGLQKTFYRAITPGAVHETELFGYYEPVIIDNSGAAPGFAADAPVQSAASWEASAPAQPAAAFKAGASYSAAESAPIGLQKTFYRAITPGAVHETELFGYSEPVIIDNSEAAPGFPADASVQSAAPSFQAKDNGYLATSYKFSDAPVASSIKNFESAPSALNFPRTYYRASNLGVTHQTDLLGFDAPVVIENLQPAPGTSV